MKPREVNIYDKLSQQDIRFLYSLGEGSLEKKLHSSKIFEAVNNEKGVIPISFELYFLACLHEHLKEHDLYNQNAVYYMIDILSRFNNKDSNLPRDLNLQTKLLFETKKNADNSLNKNKKNDAYDSYKFAGELALVILAISSTYIEHQNKYHKKDIQIYIADLPTTVIDYMGVGYKSFSKAIDIKKDFLLGMDYLADSINFGVARNAIMKTISKKTKKNSIHTQS